jgi:Cu-Zn family superoxide dismutase
MRTFTLSLCLTLLSLSGEALTNTLTKIPMHLVNEHGASSPIGEMTVRESPYGLIFTPNLTDLPPGLHGLHVHQNPSCDAREVEGKQVAGLAAGGHWDPAQTNRHAGPYGDGHLGDLPALAVGIDGRTNYPVLAPRLKLLQELQGHSLMIHLGGDNHQDHPAPLGGGGARLACGVIR